MVEILPIKLITDEDAPIFGKEVTNLGKLARAGLPVASGIATSAPELHLRAAMEHFDFGTREIFEQSLTLVRKEIVQTPLPEKLSQETGKHKKFLLNNKIYKSTKNLWVGLLDFWIEQIKERLWNKGFYPGITEDLETQVIIFVKKPQDIGSAYFDPLQDDVVIVTKEKLQPAELKKISDLVKAANKKLLIPHEYGWIIDEGIKLTGIKPYTQIIPQEFTPIVSAPKTIKEEAKCATKVFFESDDNNLSEEDLVLPPVRTPMELMQAKRDLAAKKITRKNSLRMWMKATTPENIINLEKYLEAGIDGLVLNMDELIAFFNGFDAENEEHLAFYKSEVDGLLKFLEEPLKLLHKEKVPFIASGSLVFESRVLEYLVEKGVYGVVAPKYIAHSAKDLLYQVEKRMLLRRS